MARYLGLRILQAVGVLWAAYTISFVILYLLPSDPVSMAAEAATNAGGAVDEAAIAQMQERYGLDQPVLVQYWTSLSSAVRGDFGMSITSGQSVTEAIGAAVPGTLALAVAALVLAVASGAGVAVWATYTTHSWLRNLLLALPPLGVAVPTFWVGLLLLQLFSFRLQVFPAFGDGGLAHLVLPAVTLALPIGAIIAQILATSLDSTLRHPFIDTARATGASRLRIHLRHALRLSSIPAFTIAAVLVGNLIAGAVVVETVFARAGLGRLAQTSVLTQDIPVVQGIVVFSAAVFVLVNLVVDLLYPLIDPRITANRTSAGRGTGSRVETSTTAEDAKEQTGIPAHV